MTIQQNRNPARRSGTLSPPRDLCKSFVILSLSKDLGRDGTSDVWLQTEAKTCPSLLAVWIAAAAANTKLLQRSLPREGIIALKGVQRGEGDPGPGARILCFHSYV